MEMDHEKKGRITKSMILFGTQVRGYKKEDVNRYIQQQSEQHLKETQELEQQVRVLTEQLTAQAQEQTRVNAMLAESDQIITEQRTKLAEQESALQEQQTAFMQMQQDIEALETHINELMNKTANAPKESSQNRPAATSAAKASKEIYKEKEFTEKSKRGNEDFSELTQALQNAKDKIFRFLKK
ncbi:MAG: hypothetical protein HFE78_04950 [Clostridiales bacterium]|nr:hypothetical protein [Clostridiales bacterium]